MYANKGGSTSSSLASKVCFFVKYTFKGGNGKKMNFTSSNIEGHLAMSNVIFTSRATLLMEALSIQIAHGGAFNLS